MKKVYESKSEQETFELGLEMGRQATAGTVISLDGDLGVGKTVFSAGFAKGLEIGEAICSPTFTILQVYDDGRLPLYHFDVYRIEDPDEMFEIGFEEYLFGEGVCLVEWGEQIEELLPENTICVTIEKDLEKGFDYRKITVVNKTGK